MFEKGANQRLADAGGATPLHVAAERGLASVVALLLAAPGAKEVRVQRCGFGFCV